MKIKSLAQTNFDTLFEAFNQAFVDYEVQLNYEQLQALLKRRGFTPDLSFAAFEENKIIAFTLNGIGNFNGVPTAYDTGTGTLKDYRGKGLATGIFEYSIPYLKEKNIRQYLLEVLQHNTKAVSIYRNLGFETTREFNYFVCKKEEIHPEIKPMDAVYSIRPIEIETLTSVSDFLDFHPSWQNSFESILRAPDHFISLGAFAENKLTGYCVFEPASGDVTQIAVDKQYRRKGIASLLLREIIGFIRNDRIKILNTDISCPSITDFLKAKNINRTGKQFEMIKTIRA